MVGLIVGGSLARGGADFFSDIDLYVVVRDGAFEAVLAERDAAAGFVGNPLFRFDVEPVPGGSRDQIVVFEGPIKLDFMYHRESELSPGRKWAARPVLEDEAGRLASLVSRSADSTPPSPTAENLCSLNQKFWTWCWYVFGKIVRGELWEALDGIHSIRTLALLPLLDWHAGRSREGYRRLERKVDPEMAACLQATVPTPRPDPLYTALRAEIGLFRDLREAVFDTHEVIFHPGPERIVEDAMGRIWAARGGG